MSPKDVVERPMRKMIVATTTANTPTHARLSAAVYDTEDEIDRFLREMTNI